MKELAKVTVTINVEEEEPIIAPNLNTMKFRGFHGEEVEIIKEPDSTSRHDHLIIKVNGGKRCSLHILENSVHFFQEGKGNYKVKDMS